MSKEKKAVVQDEVQKELPVVVDVAAEAKKAIVHDDEVAAIKDSRKRDLLLFRATSEGYELWDLLHEAAGVLDTSSDLYRRVSEALDTTNFLWVVAVSEHQAKLALIDRVYPLAKCSKKDRDYRLLHLLESAAIQVDSAKSIA